jgi:hypothetical protein
MLWMIFAGSVVENLPTNTTAKGHTNLRWHGQKRMTVNAGNFFGGRIQPG